MRRRVPRNIILLSLLMKIILVEKEQWYWLRIQKRKWLLKFCKEARRNMTKSTNECFSLDKGNRSSSKTKGKQQWNGIKTWKGKERKWNVCEKFSVFLKTRRSYWLGREMGLELKFDGRKGLEQLRLDVYQGVTRWVKRPYGYSRSQLA